MDIRDVTEHCWVARGTVEMPWGVGGGPVTPHGNPRPPTDRPRPRSLPKSAQTSSRSRTPCLGASSPQILKSIPNELVKFPPIGFYVFLEMLPEHFSVCAWSVWGDEGVLCGRRWAQGPPPSLRTTSLGCSWPPKYSLKPSWTSLQFSIVQNRIRTKKVVIPK